VSRLQCCGETAEKDPSTETGRWEKSAGILRSQIGVSRLRCRERSPAAGLLCIAKSGLNMNSGDSPEHYWNYAAKEKGYRGGTD